MFKKLFRVQSEQMFAHNELTIYVMLNEVIIVRSDYCEVASFEHILSALMPPNRLALIVSLCTGLRIDDVLSLKTEQIKKGRFTIKEMKTGKSRKSGLY